MTAKQSTYIKYNKHGERTDSAAAMARRAANRRKRGGDAFDKAWEAAKAKREAAQ